MFGTGEQVYICSQVSTQETLAAYTYPSMPKVHSSFLVKSKEWSCAQATSRQCKESSDLLQLEAAESLTPGAQGFTVKDYAMQASPPEVIIVTPSSISQLL